MVRGSALYMVIVIALVIGIICSTVIAAAYFYKIDYLKKSRYSDLSDNLSSGINLLLSTTDTAYQNGRAFSLFGNTDDSVYVKKNIWGVYAVAAAEAFSQRDTLFKTFTIAATVDSAKWCCLYLADNDRPFALTGKTTIQGNAFIPKAGVQSAYINGIAYQGDKRLISGTKKNSAKTLPSLDTGRLRLLTKYFSNEPADDSLLQNKDSLNISFLKETKIINFKKKPATLSRKYLSGNIIICSDTTITIDSNNVLTNILIYAKTILIKDGFHGTGQFFATDSINAGRNVVLNYPSCLGVVRMSDQKPTSQEKLTISGNAKINGLVFTYEKKDNPLKPMLMVGKKVTICGQIYSQGTMQLTDSLKIQGCIFTSTFIYRNAFTLFENYVINTTIDSKALSPYFLSSDIVPVAGSKQKVLQWLESN